MIVVESGLCVNMKNKPTQKSLHTALHYSHYRKDVTTPVCKTNMESFLLKLDVKKSLDVLFSYIYYNKQNKGGRSVYYLKSLLWELYTHTHPNLPPWPPGFTIYTRNNVFLLCCMDN